MKFSRSVYILRLHHFKEVTYYVSHFNSKTWNRFTGKEESAWPTLVHFGAQFNLLNFCDVLLSNPLMYGACVRKNKDGNLPHDIAKLHGHYELADMLKHFAEFVRAGKYFSLHSLLLRLAGSPMWLMKLETKRSASNKMCLGGESSPLLKYNTYVIIQNGIKLWF